MGSIALAGVLLWGISALFLELKNQATLMEFQTLRPVKVYFVERPEFQGDGRALAEATVAVAKQAFKDHFGFEISQMSIAEAPVPDTLNFLNQSKWDFSFGNLDFWVDFTNKKFTQTFFKNPQKELQVLLTNFPVMATKSAKEFMELRHLSSESAVSGLSHPGFVLVSSYRMNTYPEKFAEQGISFATFEDKARFLGEYVLAHELGHSLLGLEDSVYKKPGAERLRAPASLNSENFAECLMHSDEGGGYWAMAKLKARRLGEPSRCQVYKNVTEAFALRTESFELLKVGHRRQAFDKHQAALSRVEGRTQPWVKRVWEKEATLFDSSFQRWIRGIFMFQ